MHDGSLELATIESEIDLARQEGVRREENLPFFMDAGNTRSAGILLVHGFTATPWEVRPLGKALRQAGFTVMAVRLPGHGTTPEDLAGRRWEEWAETLARGFRLLSGHCSRVYGAGISTGALLLLLAAERSPLSGLVLVSPYLRLRHPLARFTGLLRYLRPYQKRPLPPDLLPYYYDRRPLNGIFQLCRLLDRLRPAVGRITTPALVFCSLGDEIVNVDSAAELFRGLGSRRREMHVFGPEAPHVLTSLENPYCHATIRMIIDFFSDLERPEGGSGG